jgi:hypothetical protein
MKPSAASSSSGLITFIMAVRNSITNKMKSVKTYRHNHTQDLTPEDEMKRRERDRILPFSVMNGMEYAIPFIALGRPEFQHKK